MEGREVLPDLMELCTLLHHDFWNPVLCPSLSAQHLPQPRLEGSFCLELGLWPVSHRTSHKTPSGPKRSVKRVSRGLRLPMPASSPTMFRIPSSVRH